MSQVQMKVATLKCYTYVQVPSVRPLSLSLLSEDYVDKIPIDGSGRQTLTLACHRPIAVALKCVTACLQEDSFLRLQILLSVV